MNNAKNNAKPMQTPERPKRPDMTLDAELTRAIQQRKIGMPRFRFPCKAEDAYRLLMSCYATEVRYRQQEPQFTEFTLDKIWQLALYITADVPKFGAMLCGNVGNGKTTMLYAFQTAVNFLSERSWFKDDEGKTVRHSIRIASTKDLIQIAKTDWKQYESIRDFPLLALDELGEEPREVRNYGDFISPIVDLIEHRYIGQRFTLITTNLAPNKLEDAYGPRVADRFREMLTIISFGNEKSFRK